MFGKHLHFAETIKETRSEANCQLKFNAMYLEKQAKKARRFQTMKLPEWAAKAEPPVDDSFKGLLNRFGLQTTTHGLKHLISDNKSFTLRFFWSIAFLAVFTMLIYMLCLIASRFQRKQFQTVIAQAKAPIYLIPFPMVIVCNKNRLNWSRMPEVKRRYGIAEHQNELFERILTAYDSLSFYRLGKFSFLSSSNLTSLNHINFTNVAFDMSWRCDEILTDCSWQLQSYNCCDLFQPRRHLLGACLAFNEDKQRKSVESGIGTGLMVRLLLRSRRHAPENRNSKGFSLNIIEPFCWFDNPIEITPYTNNNVAVTAAYFFYDNGTRAVDTHQRRCVFHDEVNSRDIRTLHSRKYMFENCLSECQQRYLMQYCNCTFDLFYPPSSYPACQLKDFPCLAKYSHLMQYFEQIGESEFVKGRVPGLVCNCFYSCHSLNYISELRRDVLNPYDEVEEKKTGMLNVYYKIPTLIIYRTSLVYTWIDILVSFGAIFVLCLGCSIISLIELSYFGFIVVPNFIWRHKDLNRLFKNIKEKFRK